MSAEDVWREKPDEDLIEAGRRLSEFTPQGEQIIRAELRRRGLPDPPAPIDYCRRCGRGIYEDGLGDGCVNCGEPLPRGVRDGWDNADDDPIVTEVVYQSRFGHEINLVLAELERAGIAAVPGLTSQYGGDYPVTDVPAGDLQSAGDHGTRYVVRVAADDADPALDIIQALPVSRDGDESDQPETPDAPDAADVEDPAED